MSEQETAKARGDGSLRLLAATAARVRGRLAVVAVLLVARVGATLAAPALLAAAVEAALNRADVTWPVTALGLLAVGGGTLEVALAVLGVSTVGVAGVWLQTRTVRHLLALGPRSPLSPGEATARVMQGAPGAAGLPITVAGSVVSLVGSVIALVVLWSIDWRSGLVFTIALPVAVLIARRFIGGATTAHARYLRAQSGIAARLLSALAGARTIQAAGTVSAEVDRVLRSLPEMSESGRELWRLQRGAVWQFKLLTPLTQVAVLMVAGLSVTGGRIAPAQLLAVVGYLGIAIGALGQIDVLLEIAQVRAGTARLAEVLDHPEPADGTRPGPVPSGEVVFRDVTVTRDGEPVLRNLCLDIPDGTAVALVGRSGAGKSLAAALIGRLADPDGGEVTVGGVPVADLRLDDLRRDVVYAFDRPALPGTTVHDAIAYGRPGLSREDVVSAALAARADAFVRRLPEGYDTPLDRAPMSGGERQRLGLARALARPARVYVLDDATSGLDMVTEAEVSEAITTRLTGRTRLVVAHRAATAARCDLVAWLESGRVRAFAPHAELWRDPDYRAVFGRDSAETATATGTGAGADTEADTDADARVRTRDESMQEAAHA
ncbi:hypothetical protein GCM10022252_46210 [Streptosporangium oxazolinicum]|uniref:ABC transporter ATP-binding protein n=1 Tax=Streptosporangium oxazolinicum TaxID=909287 RepID=A0ABP8B3Q2_9ACTN